MSDPTYLPVPPLPSEDLAEPNSERGDLLDYYLGPTGIPDRARAANELLNPIRGISDSMYYAGQVGRSDLPPSERAGFAAKSAREGVLSLLPALAAARLGGKASDAAIETLSGGPKILYHASPNPNFGIGDIEVLREGSRQSKRGRKTAGFYTTPDRDYAQRYGDNVYGISIKEDAKIMEVESPEALMRISEDALNRYREQGVDILQGLDIRGLPETVILNKDVVQSVSKE